MLVPLGKPSQLRLIERHEIFDISRNKRTAPQQPVFFLALLDQSIPWSGRSSPLPRPTTRSGRTTRYGRCPGVVGRVSGLAPRQPQTEMLSWYDHIRRFTQLGYKPLVQNRIPGLRVNQLMWSHH